jgi:hypothetical protein
MKQNRMAVAVEMDVSSGEARPRALTFGTRRVAVNEVCDRWHGQRHTWWKLATDEGQYVLVHNESSSEWELAAVVGETARDDAWPAQRRGPSH